MKLKAWHYFLIGMCINALIGYMIGGIPESGKYFGQFIFYGGIVLFLYYLIRFIYKNYKKY